MEAPVHSVCPDCNKRGDQCICDMAANPIKLNTSVLILQHPREQKAPLGTAYLAHCLLPNSVYRVGLSWPNLKKAAGRETAPKEWLALYVGSKKIEVPRNQPAAIIDRKGKSIPGLDLKQYRGIIVLDGNWAQAKTLWWRNSWLSKVHRLVLRPPKQSLYGALRKEPRRSNVSTIESIAYALELIEGDATISQKLLGPFQEMLDRYQAGL